MKMEQLEFTVLPTALLNDTGFDYPIDKLLVICLFAYNDEGEGEPTKKILADMTSTCEEVVHDSLIRLVNNGMIELQEGSRLLD
ncbi:hypothetical protein PB01_20865 (plasmid) [Psychrobacillus glaciei]|uniref:Uncharacterized protein n=1 Tax=Psychrobacillus glaciei TaxID=2283160 RepID=A0A5J6SW42_9BACI|nr:hypothetical protein [Psychrobacillus glaciei]QFG01285.1 hypothetical protein PB01_20865 [Psychrobacillus glaciei]